MTVIASITAGNHDIDVITVRSLGLNEHHDAVATVVGATYVLASDDDAAVDTALASLGYRRTTHWSEAGDEETAQVEDIFHVAIAESEDAVVDVDLRDLSTDRLRALHSEAAAVGDSFMLAGTAAVLAQRGM